ncbi:MAG: site-2 protease family protein [Clostridia bacterium]|nr:site-2 protease family protein [Clostridia bacterium]
MFDIFTKQGFIEFLYIIPALIIGLSIHEFAHAFVAYKLGDRSQKAQGRLTLDPFAHIDWIGFIALAIFKFGWAKPVQVNDSYFKNRSRDNMLVALSGPVANIIVAALFTLITKLLIDFGIIPHQLDSTSTSFTIFNIVWTIVKLNVLLAVLNMIPLPPFDGSKVLLHFIPSKYKYIMYKLEEYSLYIVLILLVTNIGPMIISPIVSALLSVFISIIMI